MIKCDKEQNVGNKLLVPSCRDKGATSLRVQSLSRRIQGSACVTSTFTIEDEATFLKIQAHSELLLSCRRNSTCTKSSSSTCADLFGHVDVFSISRCAGNHPGINQFVRARGAFYQLPFPLPPWCCSCYCCSSCRKLALTAVFGSFIKIRMPMPVRENI